MAHPRIAIPILKIKPPNFSSLELALEQSANHVFLLELLIMHLNNSSFVSMNRKNKIIAVNVSKPEKKVPKPKLILNNRVSLEIMTTGVAVANTKKEMVDNTNVKVHQMCPLPLLK
ncbi:MAG: hypothetical protein HW399_788 [Dehalococcoidia bacterium]|nr:hypothetical protein [Dehalococcoidia bacterium]